MCHTECMGHRGHGPLEGLGICGSLSVPLVPPVSTVRPMTLISPAPLVPPVPPALAYTPKYPVPRWPGAAFLPKVPAAPPPVLCSWAQSCAQRQLPPTVANDPSAEKLAVDPTNEDKPKKEEAKDGSYVEMLAGKLKGLQSSQEELRLMLEKQVTEPPNHTPSCASALASVPVPRQAQQSPVPAMCVWSAGTAGAAHRTTKGRAPLISSARRVWPALLHQST